MRRFKERMELLLYYIKKYIEEFLYCNREKFDLRKSIFRLRTKSVWLFCVEKYYRFQNWILKQKKQTFDIPVYRTLHKHYGRESGNPE